MLELHADEAHKYIRPSFRVGYVSHLALIYSTSSTEKLTHQELLEGVYATAAGSSSYSIKSALHIRHVPQGCEDLRRE